MTTREYPWKLGPTNAPLPPLVKGVPFLGSAIPFGRDPVGALLRWHRELGPVFRVQVANKTYTVLGGVEANQFITATKYEAVSNYETFIDVMKDLGTHKNLAVLDGEEHTKYRATAQSSYSRGAMAKFLPVVDETLSRFVDTIPEGSDFEVFPAFQRIISLQLGLGVANVRVDDSLDALQRYMRYLMFAHIVRLWPRWSIQLPRFRSAREESHQLIDRVLALHQSSPPNDTRPEGLIDRFLAAHRDDPVTFPLDAVRAASFGPFLAGQDTVAATTAFMLAAIHTRPALRDQVQAEVDALFAAGVPGAGEYKQAPVLAKTAKETMRRYPVAPFLPKKAACEFEFAGYRVPRGADLYIFQSRCHFEEEFYPDPWTFNIDRPTPKAVAYAPFGVGPHTCIGAGMGELQVIANVASLMSLGSFALSPRDYVLSTSTLPVSPKRFRLALTSRTKRVVERGPTESGCPFSNATARADASQASEATTTAEGLGVAVRSSVFGARTVGVSRPPGSFFRPVFVAPPVEICAPVARVWEVLMDFEKYPEWNPLNRSVVTASDGAVGDKVTLGVSWGPYHVDGQPVDASALPLDLKNTEVLSIIQPEQALAWADSLGGLHRAERVQYLVALPGGRTRYHTEELMAGLLSPLIARLFRQKIDRGFAACGEALKRRVEQLYPPNDVL